VGHKREYRRIVGGVAWPYKDQPGFLCVIGESENKTRRLNLRFNYLLVESQNKEVDKLIKKMYDFQNRYLVQPWYGDVENLSMLHFVDQFNERLPKEKKGIYISAAPFVEDTHNLRLYTHLIREQLTPAKKTLFFGQSQIPDQLNAMSSDDVQTKKAEAFPMVAALGYAILALDEPYTDVIRDRELHQAYVNQMSVEGL